MMTPKEAIKNESKIVSVEAEAVTQMLSAFTKELDEMPEFVCKSHRYIVYSVIYGDEGPRAYRNAFRTIKEVCTVISGGAGGLHGYAFKWQEVECPIDRRVYWAIVKGLKYPLVAVAALKMEIGLSDLRSCHNDEPTF